MRCEPANSLISKLGGLTKVARIIDGTPNGVMRWRMPKEKGGTGGAIPHWHITKLMAEAAEIGVVLAISDFFSLPHGSSQAAPDASEHGGGSPHSPVNCESIPAQRGAR